MPTNSKPEKGVAELMRELEALTRDVAKKYGIDLAAEAEKQNAKKSNADLLADALDAQLNRSSEDVTADVIEQHFTRSTDTDNTTEDK